MSESADRPLTWSFARGVKLCLIAWPSLPHPVMRQTFTKISMGGSVESVYTGTNCRRGNVYTTPGHVGRRDGRWAFDWSALDVGGASHPQHWPQCGLIVMLVLYWPTCSFLHRRMLSMLKAEG